MVELESISFAYRRQPVLMDNDSYVFESGQAHAITGPSGCGKSTLLYLSGLMLRPTTGSVRLVGVDYAAASDATRAHARSRLIGFVFQDALLDTSLTVWENLVEGLPWRGRRSELSRCADALERLGLAHLRNRNAAKLSGGQAQRVALVRAMAKRPPILLADEPTGNLDSVSADTVLTELVDYARSGEHLTLIVTHDSRVADACDRVHRIVDASAPGPVR